MKTHIKAFLLTVLFMLGGLAVSAAITWPATPTGEFTDGRLMQYLQFIKGATVAEDKFIIRKPVAVEIADGQSALVTLGVGATLDAGSAVETIVADCAEGGTGDCKAATKKAVDATVLTAENIKEGVSLGGLSGTHAGQLADCVNTANTADCTLAAGQTAGIQQAGTTVSSGISLAGTGELLVRTVQGFFDGTNDFSKITDLDFIADNIRAGKNLFGLSGTLEEGLKIENVYSVAPNTYCGDGVLQADKEWTDTGANICERVPEISVSSQTCVEAGTCAMGGEYLTTVTLLNPSVVELTNATLALTDAVNEGITENANTCSGVVLDATTTSCVLEYTSAAADELEARNATMNFVYNAVTDKTAAITNASEAFLTIDPAVGVAGVATHNTFAFDILVTEPQGVDFDGVTDYLSRSTDLVGNVDSKTFTFSCWVYVPNGNSIMFTFGSSSPNRSYLYAYDNSFAFSFVNSSGTTILAGYAPAYSMPRDTFVNIVITVDLNNTSNRYLYINDKAVAVTWSTFVNNAIDFTVAPITIAGGTWVTGKYGKGRLSNVFLDYTYRDLSIEANRRLFITADGKPADGQASLNPILYLPMKDAATAHINEGTGGNFTPNGTFATSNRGANQDNTVMSKFDGVSDYLSRTTLFGVADGKQFTFSCNLNHFEANTDNIFGVSSKLLISHTNDGKVTVASRNTAGSNVFFGYFSGINIKQTKQFTLSVNLSTLTYQATIDNIPVTATTLTVVDDTIQFTDTTYNTEVASTIAGVTKWIGTIGELYFDTKYIDLATSNPFWDSVENKPIPVRKVIANTGVTPLIAMPLDASNAGKNYGTGGDFTANSAPYVGVRGASEFWSRSAKFDGTTGYLSKATITPVDTKFMTVAVNVAIPSAVNQGEIFNLFNTSLGNRIGFAMTDGGGYKVISVKLETATGSNIYSNIFTRQIPEDGLWHTILFSIDIAGNIDTLYIDGIEDTDTATITNLAIPWSTMASTYIGSYSGTSYFSGNIGGLYVSDGYVDFSQETNRLKFVDGLGYPLNLAKQIEKGEIPTPLIYLPFDDTANLGKNLGTGGDFTVNGTVTAGADVSL